MREERGTKVDVATIVNDIRSGMTDEGLMARHGLTETGLRKAFGQLVDLKVLKPIEVQERCKAVRSYEESKGVYYAGQLATVVVDVPSAECDSRMIPRHFVAFPVPVHEMPDAHIQGELLDISELGVGIRGLKTRVGERKTISVHPEVCSDIAPFSLETVCRWVRKGDNGEYVAGFEIVDASKAAQIHLKELIGSMTFGN